MYCSLYVPLVGGVEDLIAEDLHVKIKTQKPLDKYHTCMLKFTPLAPGVPPPLYPGVLKDAIIHEPYDMNQ